MPNVRPVSSSFLNYLVSLKVWGLSNASNSTNEWYCKVIQEEYTTSEMTMTGLDRGNPETSGPDGTGGHSYLGAETTLLTRIKK
jgi:hypothetical protein